MSDVPSPATNDEGDDLCTWVLPAGTTIRARTAHEKEHLNGHDVPFLLAADTPIKGHPNMLRYVGAIQPKPNAAPQGSPLMQIAHIVMGFRNEDEATHVRMLGEIEALIAGSAPSETPAKPARGTRCEALIDSLRGETNAENIEVAWIALASQLEGALSARTETPRKPDYHDGLIEECAAVADNYGREGDRTSKEYACEVADEIAARIRNIKFSTSAPSALGENFPRLEFDRDLDTVYIGFREEKDGDLAKNVRRRVDACIDVDAEGNVIGVELFDMPMTEEKYVPMQGDR